MVKTVAIVGMLGSLASGPIAESVAGVDMPWPAQFGLCGLFGGLLWWHMAKTAPAVAESHAKAVDSLCAKHEAANTRLCNEIQGLRDDNRDFNDKQIALLRECLIQQRKQ